MSAPRRSSLDIDGGPVIHGAAWGCWLVAVLVWAALTRNPWYLGVTLAWVAAVSWAAQRQPLLGRAAPLWSPWRFGLVVVPLAALFNALTVHVGSATLFRLPAAWPLIGGAYTVEALVYGALNGVALTVIFAAFTVVNRMVSLRAIVQLIPRTYYPVAVVAAIAITFVPVTLRQWQQIREAQAVRGHRLRGVRSWLPLWLPLLTGGLERALQLAEAMTARGFAGGEAAIPPRRQAALVSGLAAVLVGLLLRTVWGQHGAGALLMLAGAGAIGWALWQTGRVHPRTRYRPERWQGHDWAVAAGALIAAAGCLLPLPGQVSLFFTPYPAWAWPDFAPWLGAASWGLLAPLAVWMAAAEAHPLVKDEGRTMRQSHD